MPSRLIEHAELYPSSGSIGPDTLSSQMIDVNEDGVDIDKL